MTRTKTLIVLGVFMFVLAVLAALDLTSEQQPKVADGQMVTGAMTKQSSVAEKVEAPKSAPMVPSESSKSVAAADMTAKNLSAKDLSPKDLTVKDLLNKELATNSSSSEGILLPLDDGTLRATSDSGLPLAPVAGNFQAELNKIIIEKPEAGNQNSEVAPVNPEAQKQAEAARQAEKAQAATAQANKIQESSAKEVRAPKEFKNMKEPKDAKASVAKEIEKVATASTAATATEAKDEDITADKREVTPIIINTSAPAKLQTQQKAIQSTKLELGRTIVFQVVGAAPLTAKKILLANPDRYVVDLQGDWGIVVPKVPANRLLKVIRSGTRTDATRLVFELNAIPESAEVKQINQNTLEVRIKPGN